MKPSPRAFKTFAAANALLLTVLFIGCRSGWLSESEHSDPIFDRAIKFDNDTIDPMSGSKTGPITPPETQPATTHPKKPILLPGPKSAATFTPSSK